MINIIALLTKDNVRVLGTGAQLKYTRQSRPSAIHKRRPHFALIMHLWKRTGTVRSPPTLRDLKAKCKW